MRPPREPRNPPDSEPVAFVAGLIRPGSEPGAAPSAPGNTSWKAASLAFPRPDRETEEAAAPRPEGVGSASLGRDLDPDRRASTGASLASGNAGSSGSVYRPQVIYRCLSCRKCFHGPPDREGDWCASCDGGFLVEVNRLTRRILRDHETEQP